MNKEALGELIIENQEMFYRVSKTILYNDDDCADAISNMIVTSFSKRHTLRNENYAKTWLTRILINECYQIIRKDKKVVSLDDYEESHNIVSDDSDISEYSDLYEAIMKLKEKDRICVQQYYIEGYSVREVAKMLKSSETAIRKRLARSREKLKMELGEV